MDRKAPLKYFHVSLETFNTNDLEKQVDEAITSKKINSTTRIVLSAVREIYNWKKVVSTIFPLITSILQDRGYKQCIFITNSTFPVDLTINDGISVVRIEHFAIDLIYRKKTYKVNFNQRWNADSKQALLLLGKTGKRNRLPLFYKFVESGLIEYLEHSFFPYQSDQLDIDARKEFSKLTDQDYGKFAQQYARAPDNIINQLSKGNDHITDGYPYDVTLYRSTVLSVIPESETDTTNKWVTEKTWRAIANSHPFIIVGQPRILQYLKSLGFRTFENYLLYQDYDTIEHLDTRMDMAVSNTEYFLKNYYNNVKKIDNDVQHNVNTLEYLIQSTINDHEMFQDDTFLFAYLRSKDPARNSLI